MYADGLSSTISVLQPVALKALNHSWPTQSWWLGRHWGTSDSHCYQPCLACSSSSSSYWHTDVCSVCLSSSIVLSVLCVVVSQAEEGNCFCSDTGIVFINKLIDDWPVSWWNVRMTHVRDQVQFCTFWINLCESHNWEIHYKFYDAAMHDMHAVMRDEMERKLLYLQSARPSVLTGGGQWGRTDEGVRQQVTGCLVAGCSLLSNGCNTS